MNRSIDNFANEYNTSGGGTTKEIVYLTHVLETMKQLQTCFKNQDNTEFNLYIAYLENAVLDDKRFNSITKLRETEAERLKKIGVKDKLIDFHIGFAVVRQVMKYLNDVMELEHSDSMGVTGLSENLTPQKDIVDNYMKLVNEPDDDEFEEDDLEEDK
jgi:hypothetical protein